MKTCCETGKLVEEMSTVERLGCHHDHCVGLREMEKKMSRDWYMDSNGNPKTRTLTEKFEVFCLESGIEASNSDLVVWFKRELNLYIRSSEKTISDYGWAESEAARTFVDNRYDWK